MDNLDGDEHPFRDTLAAFFCFCGVFVSIGGMVWLGHLAGQLPSDKNETAMYCQRIDYEGVGVVQVCKSATYIASTTVRY